MQKTIYSERQVRLTEKLVELRTRAGLTQRQLAKRLGIWPATIATIEKGQRRLDLPELCDYVKACGASPEKVLVGLVRSFAKVKK